MADVIARTERLILRRWAPGDLDLWLAHLNTADVRAYLGGVQPVDKVAEKFATLEQSWEDNGFSFLAVELREGGTFLGTCGIGRIVTECAPDDLRDAVQIGWQFRADQWGQGYATEAARAVLAFGFEQAGLDIIYSQTSSRNLASWGLMEKLGMKRRADLDYADPDYPPEDNPTIVYAIDREAWRAQAGEARDVA